MVASTVVAAVAPLRRRTVGDRRAGDSLIHRFTDSLIHRLTDSPTHRFID
ncbi:conserved hypothetical protein [Burkholderia pseudomallei 1106b]|uniref:Uncharacterized protein n=1 Tax=Burkholderia pseudomallei (strain 1106a) TaxID=357348 RepID=A3NT10_BURP0|nr:conserved hypothetical protein [Burkholderia pseudomallei 1106a]EES23752.1 conserved hypothetical protein [Burkholderia pseudomallei 1106b]